MLPQAAGTDDTSDLALVIASVSLGIALATFVWRVVYDIYFDAARIRVTIEAVTLTGYGGRPPRHVYLITATNVGKRPTTLTSLWLCFGRPHRWWWKIARWVLPEKRRERLFAAAIMMPDAAVERLATHLPGKLDAGEQAHVYYTREEVHKSNDSDQGPAFETIYGRAWYTHGAKSSRARRLPGDDADRGSSG